MCAVLYRGIRFIVNAICSSRSWNPMAEIDPGVYPECSSRRDKAMGHRTETNRRRHIHPAKPLKTVDRL